MTGEMKKISVVRFLLSHLVASAISFGVFVVVPVVATVVLMFVGNDPGGPMFFPIFVLMCLFFATCACGVLFAVSAILQLVRTKIPFSWWTPVVLVLPLSMAILSIGNTTAEPIGILVLGLAATLTFSTYWLTLSASTGIMNWIEKRYRNHQSHNNPSEHISKPAPCAALENAQR